MADKNNYYAQRTENADDRIEEILAELPPFCSDFFYGISNNTSALSRLNYAYDLRVFFYYLSQIKRKPILDFQLSDIDSLVAYDIERFLNYLSHYKMNGKSHSCNERGKARKLSTIRAFCKYFFSRDLIKSNVAAKVQTPKIHEKEIVRLENEEVGKLLDYAESDNAFSGKKQAFHEKLKLRDFAILSLFLGTGIRISELVGLNVDDFDFKTLSFVVTRKGGNRTILYFNDEVRTALENWLDYRYEIEKLSRDEKALFVSLKNKRISVRMVQVLVKDYAKQVTPLKKITPHKLRSTFGTALYRKTGDIYAVADFLGHKDVNTTRKHYAAISQDSRRHSADIMSYRATKKTDNDEEENN